MSFAWIGLILSFLKGIVTASPENGSSFMSSMFGIFTKLGLKAWIVIIALVLAFVMLAPTTMKALSFFGWKTDSQTITDQKVQIQAKNDIIADQAETISEAVKTNEAEVNNTKAAAEIIRNTDRVTIRIARANKKVSAANASAVAAQTKAADAVKASSKISESDKVAYVSKTQIASLWQNFCSNNQHADCEVQSKMPDKPAETLLNT